MKKRLLSVLAFALAVSAGAAFVLYQLIASKVSVGASTKPQTVRVFVAAHDLELGALIQEKDIATQEFLMPPAGAIMKKEDILNRGVTTPIHQDATFYEASLAPKGAGAGFASTIPKGMRAFAVHVNDVVGVAGFAVAGMRVDVLVSGSPPGASRETTGAVTRTMLQNIQVLSAGQNYQKDAEGKPVLVQVVNLLVTPAQAEMLNLASEQSIQLVLRNPSDQEVVATDGAATSNLFSGMTIKKAAGPVVMNDQPAPRPRVYAPPAAATAAPVAPARPQTVTIEVFQGSKRTESAFTDPGSATGARQ